MGKRMARGACYALLALVTISACSEYAAEEGGGSPAEDGGPPAEGGGPPADFEGKYIISVTNTDNGCRYANWTDGETSQNVDFEITQSESQASGNIRGLANVYFAVMGIGTLSGPVTGNIASISATGTNSIRQGRCAYVVRATAELTLTGDRISGTVTYSNETNKHADCGILETCTSQQTVAGNRRPK
jgi:hypothetical protein